MTLSLIAAGSVIATHDGTIPQTMTDAWSLSLLWCQAVAAKTSTSGSAAWFNAVSAEMGRIAWIVTDAGTTAYSASGGGVTAAAAAGKLAASFLPPDQADSVADLFQKIVAGAGGGLGGFMTTFWSSLGQTGSGTAFAVSPLELTAGGQLTTTLSLLTFAAESDDWQSFFLSRVTSSSALQCTHVRLTLNADLWQALRTPIADKLGKAAIASVLSLDL